MIIADKKKEEFSATLYFLFFTISNKTYISTLSNLDPLFSSHSVCQLDYFASKVWLAHTAD